MGIRLLLVDDSIEILETLSCCLEEEGYEVLTATNGVEALEIMELSPVALVVTDIMMPRMGGLEFIGKCRRDSSFGHVPIIVASSKYDDTSRAIASEMGVNGFFEKPINFELLHKAITLTLAKSAEAVREKSENEQYWQERRAYKRAPFLCEAYFSSESFSGATLLSSLSLGGCSLDTRLPISKGTSLNLTIKLDANHTIRVAGKVCYSIPKSGIGIQFTNLDDDSRQIIDSIVTSVCSIKSIYELEHHSKYEKILESISRELNVSSTSISGI